MKFSLNNPDKLTSNQFSKIKTDEERKVFFSSFWTTLDSYRKLKSWECVMLKVKQVFDEIFEWLERTMCELHYDKYNKRSKEIVESDEYKNLLANIVSVIKKSKQ